MIDRWSLFGFLVGYALCWWGMRQRSTRAYCVGVQHMVAAADEVARSNSERRVEWRDLRDAGRKLEDEARR